MRDFLANGLLSTYNNRSKGETHDTSTTVTKNSGLRVFNLMVTKEGKIERKMTEREPTSAVGQHAARSPVPRDQGGVRVCDSRASRSSGARQGGKRPFAFLRSKARTTG